MKRLLLTLIIGVTVGFSSNAQQETKKCSTYDAMEDAFQMYPELRENYIANQVSNYNYTKSTDTFVYTIPVVFHILHQYGSENISDAQVYDAIKILNREFNAADPDSVDIVSEFDTLIGNAKVQFKLAAMDPLGNCTNGINHIYTHETNIGDANSKLNQWNRAKYLNIWVVNYANGAAGYSIYPVGTDGNAYWLDGVVLLHNVTGSIGTSNPFSESLLTHEVGHYVSLPHVFGDVNAAGPSGPCGDDGIDDTPETRGHNGCPLGAANDAQECNPGVEEDVQNYMNYSSCTRHFTPGQVDYLRNAMEGIAGQRNRLWNDTTLIETGVKDLVLPQDPSNQLSVPLCAPVADFSANRKTTCVNQAVQFSDASWNAAIDDWAWTFEGGTPSISTSMNPSVVFATPGYKTVTLTVSNAAGSGTETRSGYVYISPEWADISGPGQINLEDGKANWFIVNNPEENHGRFQLSNGTGYNNSRAYKLNNYKNVQFADFATDNYFYNNRLGGTIDELITPSFDLRYTTGITVTFKFAYASNATQADQIEEVLRVYTSKNCGDSWTPKVVTVTGGGSGTSITGTDLVTAGYAGFTDYAPTSNNEYVEASFTYVPTSQDAYTRFKFEFEASDLSSNLYIDDIFVSGTLNLTSEEISDLDLTVYPNPTVNGEAINVSYFANDNDVTFTLRDVQGKVISTETLTQTNSEVNHTLKNSENLPSACYFLEVQSGDFTTTKKVVVM